MKFIATALMFTAMAATAGAQAVPPQLMNAPRSKALPADIASQLWPERQLSPVEAELRSRVIVMRDSLAMVDGVVERLERLGRSGSVAVARSQGRLLASHCDVGIREATRMGAFAATLETSDKRWGDAAVATFRESLARLELAMTSCRDGARGGGIASVEGYQQVGATARAAIREHEKVVKGLFKTLNIDLDPRGSRPPVYQ